MCGEPQLRIAGIVAAEILGYTEAADGTKQAIQALAAYEDHGLDLPQGIPGAEKMRKLNDWWLQEIGLLEQLDATEENLEEGFYGEMSYPFMDCSFSLSGKFVEEAPVEEMPAGEPEAESEPEVALEVFEELSFAALWDTFWQANTGRSWS